jgi:hypothetical protein
MVRFPDVDRPQRRQVHLPRVEKEEEMNRKTTLTAISVLLFALGAVAAPPTKPSPIVGAKARIGAVHINSVRVEASCGEVARFTVEVQNGLTKVAHLGSVFVGSANSPGNRTGNPTAEFRNLAPGQRVTLTLPSTWHVSCEVKQGQTECFEVGITMEPDNTANGEVWDQVWHRVCAQIPKAGQKSGPVTFNDTTFKR